MMTWFLGLAIKATLLLLSVGAAAAGARRSPAATRHFVWLSGLAALLLLPVLGALTPGWSPAWAGDWLPAYLLTDAAGVAADTPEAPFAVASPPMLARVGVVAEADAGARGVQAGAADGSGPPIAAAGGPTLHGSSVVGALRASTPLWLTLAWVGGALAMMCWLAVGFVRRARLARRAVVVDAGPMAGASDVAAQALGLRRSVRLLLGDPLIVPMTWGFMRPVLYLPAAAEGWSKQRLNTVLLHELAHIKRYDSLSRSMAQLACSVFWFHPLAWVSARRMLREQERACDDVVILAGANPHSYAETLVAIAREFRSPRPSVVGALAFARRSNLEHRLLSILDPLKRRKTLSLSRKVVVLALFVGVALPLAALHPAASAQEPAPVPRSEPQSKPRPKVAVAVNPQAAPRVQVGVVIPRVDVPAPQVGVVVPRADAPAPQVDVVVPRADAPAPQAEAVWSQRPLVGRMDGSSRIQLEAEGAIRITGSVADVELEDSGWLVLTEQERRLEMRPSSGGGLDFAYSVDGAEADFDDEAREWADGILEQMVEMGTVRGNVFISVSRASIGGEVAPLVEIEPLQLAAESLALTTESLELAVEPLVVTVESLGLAAELLELSESPELTVELLELSESPELIVELLELSESPELIDESHELAEALALTIEPLEIADTLELVIEPLEIAESLALAIEPLALVEELSLTEAGRPGRFDRLFTWSEGGSQFVTMWRGAVDLGGAVDDIGIGDSGDLVIDERSADGVHRRLHVFAGESGETTFEWFVDGEATAFDADGRAWLQPVLDWLNENAGGG